MIRIGSISRWQHLGPFVSEGRLIHRLEENEKIALSNNERAKNNIFELFHKLQNTPIRIRLYEGFDLPEKIQEELYHSVFDYELREKEAEIEEQHEVVEELRRNARSSNDGTYNLEIILAEDHERKLRGELNSLANDEGVKHFRE